MKIALTTDHAGFEALTKLKDFLTQAGHQCVDFGPVSFDPEDDYPDFIFPAAGAVASGDCEVAIIMGGSGQGAAIAANRINGVRAAVYYGPATAKTAVSADGEQANDEFEILRLSRQHNNANVLSLAARFLSQDEILQAAEIWLNTEFSGAERHQRRIAKLDQEA